MVFFQVLILEEDMKLHLISAQNKSIANNKSITNTHEIGSSVEMFCCFFFLLSASRVLACSLYLNKKRMTLSFTEYCGCDNHLY